MIDTTGTVVENIETASGYRLLTLESRAIEDIQPKAGQFAMVKAHDSFEPLLRRALAIYKVYSQGRVSFLYQVLGRGTQSLASLQPGSKVDALLPLGNVFPSETSTDPNSKAPNRAIIVSGGIGSASLLMLAREYGQRRDISGGGIDARVFFGAANKDAAIGCGLRDFQSCGLPIVVTTDDGGLGEKGFVTSPLERELQKTGGVATTIYACGPWAMMARTAEIAAKYGAYCLVSLEAPMGCGFGICVGCVFAVKSDGPPGYHSYKRVCIDGSIVDASTVGWDVTAMSH
ncbi:MAG TPA: dihydroorotate dehydrogenase electron transfer subunit [Blastocatellia bacterium]|nr:dihydroorotate dehydrogenase electron transfer subunit [Blastocatellia bacterium]